MNLSFLLNIWTLA